MSRRCISPTALSRRVAAFWPERGFTALLSKDQDTSTAKVPSRRTRTRVLPSQGWYSVLLEKSRLGEEAEAEAGAAAKAEEELR